MKVVTVEAICSGKHSEPVTASVEFEVSIKGVAGGKPVVVDACGSCAKGPVAALIDMIEREQPKRRPRKVKGFACDEHERVFETERGLRLHVAKSHR